MQHDLVEAAQRGDHEAFERLTAAAGDRLFGFARLVLADAQDAEDAVQECITCAWRGLPLLRDPDRWDAWLHRLIVNAVPIMAGAACVTWRRYPVDRRRAR